VPIIGLVAVIAVAAASYLVMLKLKDAQTIETQNLELTELQSNAKTIEANLAPFVNGEMKVKNVSNKSYYIAWYGVTYKDENGELVSFDFEDVVKGKRNPVYPLLEPGRAVELEHVEDGKVAWDGSVIFYAIELYDVAKGTSTYFSGIWSQNADEGVLKLDP